LIQLPRGEVMSYDRQVITAIVREKLAVDPTIKLRTLSHQMLLDRHTINQALRSCVGLTFRAFKAESIANRIKNGLASPHAKSIKEMAADMGFAPGASFTRRSRRVLGLTPSDIRSRSPK